MGDVAALATVESCTTNLIPNQHEYSVYQTMAKQAASSKFFANLGGEAGIATIMLYARELGIAPMQAITGGLHNIQGRIEMSSRMINSRIRQAGHRIQILESTETVCRIHGTRKDTGEQHEECYSIDMAKRAGLVKPGGNWDKIPEDMLFARCISRLGRRLFPDVLGTAYAEGEISEHTNGHTKTPARAINIVQPHSEDIIVDGTLSAADPVDTNAQFEQIKSDITNINNAPAVREYAKRWAREINAHPRKSELVELGKARIAELEAGETNESIS